MNTKKKNLNTLWVALIVLGSCTLLSYMDANEEADYLSQYCDNVKDGTWPNFKEIDLETSCKNN